MIDAFCTEPSYFDHLSPVLEALPRDRRGQMYAPVECARDLPLGAALTTYPPENDDPLLVGGFQNLGQGRRPKVLVNHGAGQRYEGFDGASFVGGPNRACALSLHPSERCAQIEQARYPDGRAVAVGCPKLDRWARIPAPAVTVVAFTFHWPSRLRSGDGISGEPIPEAGTAWPDWRAVVEEFVKFSPWPVLGHAHPRDRREKQVWWESLGVEFVAEAADLVRRASVLVVDNTSFGFEWAALDRPTVWLDGDGWRHGFHGPPRFSEVGMLPGPTLIPPCSARMLEAVVGSSIAGWGERRWNAVHAVYGPLDGRATERAVAAILAL